MTEAAPPLRAHHHQRRLRLFDRAQDPAPRRPALDVRLDDGNMLLRVLDDARELRASLRLEAHGYARR